MRLDGKAGAAAHGLAVLVVVGLLASGCGDYYRPVANPVFPPGGDPQAAAHVVAIAQNDPNPGTAVVIDVSGDVAVSAPHFAYGERRSDHPVHVVSTSGILNAFVADRDSDLLTAFNQFSDPSNPPNATTLPPGGKPVYVAVVPRKVFVAESGLNSVADVNILSTPASLTTQIPVGNKPVALVPLPDGTKVYCINQTDHSVSVIVSANDTVIKTITLSGSTPVWGAVSTDGTRVFVVNQGSANVSVIETVGDSEIGTFPVGAGPNYAVYQASQNRLYVTSLTGKSLSIFFSGNSTPANPLPTPQTVSMAGAPCNAASPVAVTALADGSRAYVADTGNNVPGAGSVCVLNATSNTFVKSIPVGTGPVSITSDPGSTRVYTANAGTTVGIQSISRDNSVHTPTLTCGGTTVVPNCVTITTSGSNPFKFGQSVTISGVSDPSLEGLFVITQVLSTTQFTYVQAPNVLPLATLGAGGTATVSDVSIIQTSTDAPVLRSDGKTPLTIPVQGSATFITPAP